MPDDKGTSSNTASARVERGVAEAVEKIKAAIPAKEVIHPLTDKASANEVATWVEHVKEMQEHYDIEIKNILPHLEPQRLVAYGEWRRCHDPIKDTTWEMLKEYLSTGGIAMLLPRDYVTKMFSISRFSIEEFNKSFTRLLKCTGSTPNMELAMGLYQAMMPANTMAPLISQRPKMLAEMMLLTHMQINRERQAQGMGEATAMDVDELSVNKLSESGWGLFVKMKEKEKDAEKPKMFGRNPADGELIGMVDETATLPVRLRSNVNTYITFLVAPISSPAILGMPWIIDHDGKINTVDWMLELSFGKIRAVLPCARGLQNEQPERSFISSINLAMYEEIIALEEANEIAHLEIIEFADKILQINEVRSTAKAVTDARTLALIKRWKDVFAEPPDTSAPARGPP
ncbi:hypothetical protein LPJ59_006197, partial [Coemansia sp. RSA 2399]